MNASTEDKWQELSIEDIETQRGDHKYILIHYCSGEVIGKTSKKPGSQGGACVLPVNQESVFAQEVETFGANFARTSDEQFAGKYGIKKEAEALVLFKESQPNIYNGTH